MKEIFIKKLIVFIKNHYFILITGIFLSLIILGPVIIYPFVSKETYRGINIAYFGSDAHFYTARAKEALEGNKLGNPLLQEDKNNQDLYFMYNERLLMAPLRLVGMQDVNVVTVYNIYNFIGIFVIILLIYFFVLQLSGDKLLAVISAVSVVGGYHIVYNKTLFYNDFNIYGRTMYPYISSLAFFAYLNALIKSIKTKKIAHTILTGLLFGFLFYIYFYTWTFVLALNGALLLLYLIKRDRTRFKIMAGIMVIGFLVGLYNLIKISLFFSSEAGVQASYFFWSAYERAPIFSKIGAAALLLLGIFKYKKRQDPNIILIFALILAIWISLNQQILTGRILQIGHYYWYFIVPVAIIVGLYMIWFLIKKELWQKIFFVLLMLIIFLHAGIGQSRSMLTTLELKDYEQLYKPIINNLKNDAKHGVILAADDQFEYLFTIYTNHDLFWNSSVTLSDIPIDRLSDALHVYIYLNKEARNDFSGYINRVMKNEESQSFYKNLYKTIEGYQSGFDFYQYNNRSARQDEVIIKQRKKLIAILSAEYESLFEDSNGFKNLLDKYKVNYIVWDKNNYPEWDLSFIEDKEEIISNNNIILYKLN